MMRILHYNNFVPQKFKRYYIILKPNTMKNILR